MLVHLGQVRTGGTQRNQTARRPFRPTRAPFRDKHHLPSSSLPKPTSIGLGIQRYHHTYSYADGQPSPLKPPSSHHPGNKSPDNSQMKKKSERNTPCIFPFQHVCSLEKPYKDANEHSCHGIRQVTYLGRNRPHTIRHFKRCRGISQINNP